MPTVSYAGIPHIKLPGPKHLTIFDKSHGSTTHNWRQPYHQGHKTIWRHRELAFGGGFHYVCTSLELLQARTSPLAG